MLHAGQRAAAIGGGNADFAGVAGDFGHVHRRTGAGAEQQNKDRYPESGVNNEGGGEWGWHRLHRRGSIGPRSGQVQTDVVPRAENAKAQGEHTVASWEDELINELKQQQKSKAAAARAADERGSLDAAYAAASGAVSGAVERVSEALGTPVEQRSEDDPDRMRWACGPRTLTLRIDREAAKVFAAADLGRDLVMEEFEAGPDGLLDARGRPVEVADIAKRFVSLLFRGA